MNDGSAGLAPGAIARDRPCGTSSQSSSRLIRVSRTGEAGPPSTWQREQVASSPSASRNPAIDCGPQRFGSKRGRRVAQAQPRERGRPPRPMAAKAAVNTRRPGAQGWRWRPRSRNGSANSAADDQPGHHLRGDELERAREVLQQLEQRQEVPLRAAARSWRRRDWRSRRGAPARATATVTSAAKTAAIITVSLIDVPRDRTRPAGPARGSSGPEMPCRRIRAMCATMKRRPGPPAAGRRARRTSGRG